MKKEKKVVLPQLFAFWKNNLKAGYFTLDQAELKEKFLAYLATKENSYLQYYGSGATIMAFVMDKKGLSSVADENETEALYELLFPVFMSQLKD